MINLLKKSVGSSGWHLKYFLMKFSILILTIFVSSISFASHFRSGSLTATRLSETATDVTYRLNYSSSWRLNAIGPAPNFIISGGNSSSIFIPVTTTLDPSNSWENSVGTATVTLNKSATPTRLEWINCCKILTTVNNNGQNWDVYTIINTNAPGSSPVSTLPAIINMPINAAATTYAIAASDPDAGSTLTYGLAPLTGGFANETQPSGFSVNASTGIMTFNTIGKQIGQQYNAMVTISDNDGNLIMIDFLINMVGAAAPPVFDYSNTPPNGTVFNTTAGQPITFPISVSDPNSGNTTSISVSGLPSYITPANFSNNALPATGNPAKTVFAWTPTTAQNGNTIVLNIIATNNVGVQNTTAVVLKVAAEPVPVFVVPTPVQGLLTQIEPGNLYSATIVAASPIGSNVSIAYSSGVPSGAVLSPAIPTLAANPGLTNISWKPVSADFGIHSLKFEATIASNPNIFATLSYQIVVNTLPAFSSAAPISIIQGQLYSYPVTVTDLDIPYGDVVNISSFGLPAWLTLVSTGNGTAVLSGTPAISNIGTTAISLLAEDTYHHGNSRVVAQNFNITVIPAAPIASCKSITGNLNSAGNLTIAPSDIDNGSSSSIGAITMTVSPSVFDCSKIGPNQVLLTVTDINGNTATCNAVVTIQDIIAPIIIVKNISVTVPPDGNFITISAADINAGSTDNCSISSLQLNKTNFNINNLGSNTVTLTVIDNNGNSALGTAIVTVLANGLNAYGQIVTDRNVQTNQYGAKGAGASRTQYGQILGSSLTNFIIAPLAGTGVSPTPANASPTPVNASSTPVSASPIPVSPGHYRSPIAQ